MIPYSVDPVIDWTIQSVRNALASHERGQFNLSADLVDAFGRDDRITACLATRIKAITSRSGLAFSIEPSDQGPKARNQRLADEVSSWWFDQLPEPTQARIHRDGILLGVCIARVDWSRGRTSVPTVRPWPMQFVSWDESAQRFAVDTRQGRMLVDPDDDEWLIYTPYGYDRAWMGGLVRALGLLFILRQFASRDWARFSERHGLPIIVIKEPSSYPDEDRARFASEIRNMGTKGVVRLTQAGESGEAGFGIEFLEPRDTSWQSFEAWKGDLNSSIAILLLGQNLTTEVQGGSFAAARVQDRVRADYLASDTEALATMFRGEIIQPWLARNHGLPSEQAPWPTWESAIPEDREAIAKAYKLGGEALAAIQATGLRADYLALVERLGIPMLPGEPFEEEPEPAVEPPKAPPEEPPADGPPAEPMPMDADVDEEPEATSVTLASGDDPASAAGFVAGQMYADRLVASATKATQAAIAPTIDAILDRLATASSFEEARAIVVELYTNANLAESETIAERALILAELAGHAAVVEDL